MSVIKSCLPLRAMGVLGIALGLWACGPSEPVSPRPPPSSLFLEVQSPEGSPVPNARVRLASGEHLTTDEQGQLLLEQLEEGENPVQVEVEGFAPAARTFTLAEHVRAGSRIQLLPLGDSKTFDTAQGASLESGNVDVEIPPGSLLDAEGRPIEGEVEAFFRALDLEKDELRLSPGEQLGVVSPELPPVPLESMGVMVLDFRQKSPTFSALARGLHSQAAPRRLAIKVRGRAPGSVRIGSSLGSGGVQASALAEPRHWRVPIWRLDERTGYWVYTQELGTLVESATEPGTYTWTFEMANPPRVINVALPYWWHAKEASADNPLKVPTPAWVETTCLRVTVQDTTGKPVVGRTVVAQGVDYVGLSRGTTGPDGSVLLEVMRDRNVKVSSGEVSESLKAGSQAGNCKGEGAEPAPVVLGVPAPMCVPGAESVCGYGGPQGTLGLGVCRAASRYCNAEGSAWGNTCQGEVRPQEERCDTAVDDDCDGFVNEACASLCWEGAIQPCYEGAPGTQNVGVCRGGTRTCVAGGTAWSACVGQVLPEVFESCARPEDENCDGIACLCRPGETQRCGYSEPGGTENVGACRASFRTCNDSGTSWSDCSGEVTPQPEEDCTTPVDDDCDGTANESTVCVCTPQSVQECPYDAPEGTQDKGVCKAATRQCNDLGTAWSACTGGVLPLPEDDCTTPVDDDCDGEVNEGSVCICIPNSTQDCPYSGPAGTKGVGVCRASIQQCNASGSAWGACAGEVKPQAESCASALDEDCDGQRNEAPPCGWVGADSLSEARSHHQAVMLSNGQMLVMGGVSPNNVNLSTAELYDPVTRTWTPTGSMNVARKDFVAVRLNDGTVLVAGGMGSKVLMSAEVYDPGKGTWTVVGNMLTAREHFVATLLRNGKVLVTGGNSNTAEVYDPDPAKKTWASVASMGVSRAKHTATLLSDGKVLVAGGFNGSSTIETAEVYDLSADTWTRVDDMQSARVVHTATLLRNGKVLVTGGYTGSATVKTAEVYDPVNNEWKLVGSMRTVRDEHRAVLLSSGHVLVTGGDDTAKSTDTAELYEPDDEEWTTVPSMNVARAAHTMVVLGGDEVLVMGGQGTSTGPSLATVEVYNSSPQQANTSRPTGSLEVPRKMHTATVLNNGKVLVVGGSTSTGVRLASAELYDPVSGTWSPTRSMNSPREAHTATLLSSGKVLVAGGHNGDKPFDTAEVYDPATDTWADVPKMTSPRQNHSATLLHNGQVLVVGGRSTAETDSTITGILSTAELYDPAPGKESWSQADSPGTSREKHVAVRLNNDRVLILGGFNLTNGFLESVKEYNPASTNQDKWSTAIDMIRPNNRFTATLMTDGRVLVTGGFNTEEQYLNTAELYNPTGTKSTLSTENVLGEERESHTATLLRDGRVLITGGFAGGSVYRQTSMLYDPNPKTWSAVSSLTRARGFHTATLLGNGKVLLSGGENSAGILKSAELFQPPANP